jgi:hypothetical protein
LILFDSNGVKIKGSEVYKPKATKLKSVKLYIDDNPFNFYYTERTNLGFLHFSYHRRWYKIQVNVEGVGNLIELQPMLYTVRSSAVKISHK